MTGMIPVHLVMILSTQFIKILRIQYGSGPDLQDLTGMIKESGSFKRFRDNIRLPDNPRYLNSPEVTSICEDGDGFLWIGTTTGGLSKFYPKSELFIHFKHEQQNAQSISSNRIVCLYNDKMNRLWIGTFGGGLNLYDDQNNSFTHFMAKDGLPHNTIKAISEDNNGNLLITTSNGISIFDPDKKIFNNFDGSDGLQGTDFNPGSVFRDEASGELFFGGTNGLNIYSAESVPVSSMLPEIVITEFKIFDKPAQQYSQSIIKKDKNGDDKIVLSHNENFISFEFAALDFTSPEKNKYAYMLEGFDKEWIYSGSKREATYTNLDPGRYTFKVKASNSDGQWNETGISVPFIIEPPFWKTWWAYSFYVLLIAAGFLSIRKYELNRIHLRNKLKLKEFESTKLLEVNKIKSTFFANISHEFRTPLTIILGSLDKLKKEMAVISDIKEYDVMKRNASRLLQLINQLLELSRIESGNVTLSITESDIVSFIKRTAATFTSLAYQKNQKIYFNGKEIESAVVNNEILLCFDKKKTETVFYNLLSNAIKFSPEGEKIKIKILRDNEFVKITLINTGVEIPPENLNKVFERFYQVDDSGIRNFEGTGIGLALAKEYVELHNGKIEVESGSNETIFNVYLKTGKSHFNPDQISATETEELSSGAETSEFEMPDIFTQEVLNSELLEDDRTSILIVEDNFDLREMIKGNLKDNYAILEADNGKTGFAIAEEKIPDLIISDIMMPEMDGYELSRLIKTNEKTNHIPVIILTAKASQEDKIGGLETGADDYLIKPFDEQELKVRVRNLIKIRQQMREKFQSQMLIKPGEVIIPSTQKTFIDKLIKVIEINISNENFSVEVLCNEVGMSRSQLHRKIKAVTNQSTSEFIRNFRLQRAAELLKQDAGNIAQICYMVGFNSQNYFTKMFQNLYGKTPLEYKREHTK
jgi:signal transduction histidine kinase/DNA-binding response OmpR family regulator